MDKQVRYGQMGKADILYMDGQVGMDEWVGIYGQMGWEDRS